MDKWWTYCRETEAIFIVMVNLQQHIASCMAAVKSNSYNNTYCIKDT